MKLWGVARGPAPLGGRARSPAALAQSVADAPATAVQAAALVIWHMPALFDRALRSNGWHVAQHLSFVAAAVLFWSAMVSVSASRATGLAAALVLFVTWVSAVASAR